MEEEALSDMQNTLGALHDELQVPLLFSAFSFSVALTRALGSGSDCSGRGGSLEGKE